MKLRNFKPSRSLSSPKRVALLIAALLFWALNIFIFYSHLIAVTRLPDTAPVSVPDGIVFQSTDYSCGPASLSTLFRHYNILKSEREWAELAGTNLTVGTRLSGLIAAGESMGFEGVELNPTFEQLDLIYHPAILFQSREYHLVSFWGIGPDDKAIIRDPVLGKISWDSDRYKYNTPHDPILLVFYPGSVPVCDRDSASREIGRIQNMLSATGHYTGNVDGSWSGRLGSSISSFQSSVNLERTGIVDPQTSIYLEGAWRLITHGAIEPFRIADRTSDSDSRTVPIVTQFSSGNQ